MILAIVIYVKVSTSPYRVPDEVVRALTAENVGVLNYSRKKQFNSLAKPKKEVRTFCDDEFPEKLFQYWLNGVT